jgi:FixJ family two-component response regulator
VTDSERVVAVVEDDDAARKAVGRLLRAHDYDTAMYPSAEAYLAARHDFTTLCLLLDIGLGGMSGFELHERLQADGEAPPTVIITALDDPAVRRRAEASGCIAFFQKPVSGDSLLAVIRSIAVAAPEDVYEDPEDQR